MRVEMENNSSCLNYFELLFTDKKNEKKNCQKRHLDPNSRHHLHNLTVPELKAWLGLTLAMGLVKKPNLKSYWCNKSVIKTPLFPNTMSRYRYLTTMLQTLLTLIEINCGKSGHFLMLCFQDLPQFNHHHRICLWMRLLSSSRDVYNLGTFCL